jgi:cell division protein FtsW
MDPFGRGYHLIQSFQAFRNGGIFGAGPGNGIQKLGRLPEAHTDFVFSVIGEEIGLIGGLMVILLFATLIFRALRIAMKQTELSYFLLASGLAAYLGLETVIHMGVALGILPTTGLPLPFVSYGRTSLVMKLFSAGILLRLSREIPASLQERFSNPTSFRK